MGVSTKGTLAECHLNTIPVATLGRFGMRCARSVVDLVTARPPFAGWPGATYLRRAERWLSHRTQPMAWGLPDRFDPVAWGDGPWVKRFFDSSDDATYDRDLLPLQFAGTAVRKALCLPEELVGASPEDERKIAAETVVGIAAAAAMALDICSIASAEKWPVPIEQSPALHRQIEDLMKVLRLKPMTSDERVILVGFLSGFGGSFRDAVGITRRLARREPTERERAAIDKGANLGTLDAARLLGHGPEECVEIAQAGPGLLEWVVGEWRAKREPSWGKHQWNRWLEIPTAPVHGMELCVEVLDGTCLSRVALYAARSPVEDEPMPTAVWHFPHDYQWELRPDLFLFAQNGPHDHWIVTEVLGYEDVPVEAAEIAVSLYREGVCDGDFASAIEMAKGVLRPTAE